MPLQLFGGWWPGVGARTRYQPIPVTCRYTS